MGYQRYQAIARKSWQAECVYAVLLYPERMEIVERLFRKEAGHRGAAFKEPDFKNMVAGVKAASQRIISATDWTAFDLVGFTVCLCQFTSSLYFIREIKKRRPELPVVVGGSLVSGISPQGLFEHFPEIDFIVVGEGERPLNRLAAELLAGRLSARIVGIPGLTARSGESGGRPTFDQLQDLAVLPHPDYDDYFMQLYKFPAAERFFPNLPVEISRGCWWRAGRNLPEKDKAGCAFCNLNLQWRGYRAKTAKAVVAEIDTLTSRHKTLAISIVDNVLPVKNAEKIFAGLRRLNKDFNLFCEVRASLSPRLLAEMRRTGVRQIQVGIEALSSRLLRKMNKGTTVIHNLAMMKHCEELGIVNTSNLILHFPGSDEEDVAETLRCLEFVRPFRPLKTVEFRLGLGSPVMRSAAQYGLTATFNHPSYRMLLPPAISASMALIHQAYRGNLVHQKKIWRPVEAKVAAWQADYAALRRDSDQGPILGYQDGRDFLIIRQKRPDAEPLTHRLEGVSRKIYLFCRHHRRIERILAHFPGLAADKLLPFLNMMTDKHLMYAEGDCYLSLAVALNASRTFSIPLQSPFD